MKQNYRKHILSLIKQISDEKTLRQIYVYVENSAKESVVSK